MPRQTQQQFDFALQAPQLARYQCTGRDRVFVAPNAFPFLLIPSVVVVRLAHK